MTVERNRDSQVAYRADSLATEAGLHSKAPSGETGTEVKGQTKVSIVVFSPSGNTLEVGRMLEEHLSMRVPMCNSLTLLEMKLSSESANPPDSSRRM